MAKAKVKVPAVPAPQNLEEAADYLRRIGEVQRKMDALTGEMNEKIEQTKKPYVENTTKCRQRIDELVGGLYAYAASHRAELTDADKRKTVSLPTGVMGWRLTPKAVTIKGVQDVIKRLKQLQLFQFIRTKEEIDKESMLKEENIAQAVEGVTIGQHEEFFIKPAEATAEVSVTPGRQALKVALSTPPAKKPARRKSA